MVKNNTELAYEVDCTCYGKEGCECQAHSLRSQTDSPLPDEPLVLETGGDCVCEDPFILERIRREVEAFVKKKFRSKKWLKSVFGKKRFCADHRTRIKTRVLLTCNPKNNERRMHPDVPQKPSRRVGVR